MKNIKSLLYIFSKNHFLPEKIVNFAKTAEAKGAEKAPEKEKEAVPEKTKLEEALDKIRQQVFSCKTGKTLEENLDDAIKNTGVKKEEDLKLIREHYISKFKQEYETGKKKFAELTKLVKKNADESSIKIGFESDKSAYLSLIDNVDGYPKRRRILDTGKLEFAQLHEVTRKMLSTRVEKSTNAEDDLRTLLQKIESDPNIKEENKRHVKELIDKTRMREMAELNLKDQRKGIET